MPLYVKIYLEKRFDVDQGEKLLGNACCREGHGFANETDKLKGLPFSFSKIKRRKKYFNTRISWNNKEEYFTNKGVIYRVKFPEK